MYCPVCHSEYPPDWKACPKDATGLLRSSQIGKYRIEGLLGVGGMGAVYRATNPDIRGSRVAIKVMNPAVAGAEATRERFKREAAAVAALRTSHVVKVFDFDAEPDGALYLVMELLDGHSLREEITPAPQYMDLARVQMVMDGSLKGLAAAHKSGIVHRDLKPENIFIADTDDGEVAKLLDFGIARVKSTDKNLTHTGSLMGTASYMAIEQIAANSGDIGPHTDVYAMGAILYEMLAGAPAFGGNTITEVLQRVLQATSVPLASLRTGLPAEVYALVDRCMSTEVAQRPANAEALRQALLQARLVPIGVAIPPAYNTKVDAPAPDRGSHASNVGSMPTEAHNTPVPVSVTPHGLAAARSNPQLMATPAADRPLQTLGTGAGAAPIANGTGDGAIGRTEIVARKRSILPFVIGGVLVLGAGAIVIAKAVGVGGGSTDAPRDAAVVAPVVIDAPAVASPPIDAPAPDVPEAHDGMVRIEGGDKQIGLDGAKGEWLSKRPVSVQPYFIDKHEMTHSAIDKALGPKLPAEWRAKTKKDAAGTPARHVSWADAAAACASIGKRLPTEAEWELAAETTPKQAALARLLRKNSEADLAAPSQDCSADGLCDMLGSLSEWTADDVKAGTKAVRGASYRDRPGGKLDTIHQRQAVPPGDTDNTIGFRCARSANSKGQR